MSPDDDWALGQNEVDVRNEAWRPLNAAPYVFVCHAPEQAWIDESRAESEREDTDNEERTG